MVHTLISVIIPCFNSGPDALATMAAVNKLTRPEWLDIQGVIVDDGSTDESKALSGVPLPEWVEVVRAGANLGRGGAINLGVDHARGSLLLILDSDCLPTTDGFLLSHLETLSNTADVSIGDVQGTTGGFWGRYLGEAGARRKRAAGQGALHGMTTANMMLHASTFRHVGGFDSRYRHYGFEDRDFLLRLSASGRRLRHTPAASVVHADNVNLPTVCRKMRDCGRFSAPLFRADHPNAYRQLGYAFVDAHLHPRRTRLVTLFARMLLARTIHIEGWLHRSSSPYFLRAAVVRLASAMAFALGTQAVCREAQRSSDCSP